jgi:hypothetical protein
MLVMLHVVCCRRLITSGVPLEAVYPYEHVGVVRVGLSLPGRPNSTRVVVKITPDGVRQDAEVQVGRVC